MDGIVYSLNPTTGATIWQYPPAGQAPLNLWDASVSMGPDDTIYVAAASGLIALNPDGTEKWQALLAMSTVDDATKCSPVISSCGNVFVGRDNSFLYGFASDGSTLAGFPAFLGYVCSSPTLLSDDSLLVPIYGPDIFHIGSLVHLLSNGSTDWSFTGCGSFYCAPVVAPDGTIYVGDECGSIFA